MIAFAGLVAPPPPVRRSLGTRAHCAHPHISGRGPGHAVLSSSDSTVRIEEAGAVLAPGAVQLPGTVALLIYLNERAFTDAGGVVAATMRAMDARLPIVLVHAAG